MKKLKNKKVLVGFDGYIDTISRPIKDTKTNETFSNIEEFGSYIASKANVSCSIELLSEKSKYGGNMPHLAYSLARKDAVVTAVGMLGDEEISKEFDVLLDTCKVYSFANAGQSTAMEFLDGKVFFSPKVDINCDAYSKISTIFDVNSIPEYDILALVNWSELDFSDKLWNDVFNNHFENIEICKQKYVFFDLCDFYRKQEQDILNVISLMSKFSQKRTAILSLNENEAKSLAEIYKISEESLSNVAKRLREKTKIDEIIIHTTKASILSTERSDVFKATEYIEKPKISTGSGDNFNATYIFAKLLEKDDQKSIEIANFGAYFYVKNGYPATFADMKHLI